MHPCSSVLLRFVQVSLTGTEKLTLLVVLIRRASRPCLPPELWVPLRSLMVLLATATMGPTESSPLSVVVDVGTCLLWWRNLSALRRFIIRTLLWVRLSVYVTLVVLRFLFMRCSVQLMRTCLFIAMSPSLMMQMLLLKVVVVATVSVPALESPLESATIMILLFVLCVRVTVRLKVQGPIRLATGRLLFLMSSLQKCWRERLMLLLQAARLNAMESGSIASVGPFVVVTLVVATLEVELATT